MQPLTTPELLAAWDQGIFQAPAQRALTLLGSACPELSAREVAQLSIGRRDACLITLRSWTFGPQIEAVVSCPECSDKLEFALALGDIRIEAEDEQQVTYSVSHGEHHAVFRLPTGADMVALDAGGEDDPRRRLLEICTREIRRNAEPVAFAEAPEALLDAVEESMRRHDPQADVRLSLSCEACGNRWHEAFDIVSFLWRELHDWSRRLLGEIHVLASAYGWSESEILSLSAQRRRNYLELCGA